jgi:hypothetical protein
MSPVLTISYQLPHKGAAKMKAEWEISVEGF